MFGWMEKLRDRKSEWKKGGGTITKKVDSPILKPRVKQVEGLKDEYLTY